MKMNASEVNNTVVQVNEGDYILIVNWAAVTQQCVCVCVRVHAALMIPLKLIVCLFCTS